MDAGSSPAAIPNPKPSRRMSPLLPKPIAVETTAPTGSGKTATLNPVSFASWEDCGVTQPTPSVLSGYVGARLLVE